MIAVIEPRCRVREDASPSFEELLPAIEQQAVVAFRYSPPSEREDLIAETVANAFCAYSRLVDRGMADVAYATPLACYAIKQIRSGRRVGSKLNVRDATSEYCQLAKGIRIERLDRFDPEEQGWQEIVVEDRHAGPADIAAMRIDFAAWLKTLAPRLRRIAKTLAAGETTSGVARRFGVSRGRVSQIRRELMQAWAAFQGEVAAA